MFAAAPPQCPHGGNVSDRATHAATTHATAPPVVQVATQPGGHQETPHPPRDRAVSDALPGHMGAAVHAPGALVPGVGASGGGGNVAGVASPTGGISQEVLAVPATGGTPPAPQVALAPAPAPAPAPAHAHAAVTPACTAAAVTDAAVTDAATSGGGGGGGDTGDTGDGGPGDVDMAAAGDVTGGPLANTASTATERTCAATPRYGVRSVVWARREGCVVLLLALRCTTSRCVATQARVAASGANARVLSLLCPPPPAPARSPALTTTRPRSTRAL